MQRILIVDGRRMIGDSIKMQIMIEEDEDLYDVTSCAPENTDELKASIQGKYFDFVLVEHDMLTDVCTPKHFAGVKVYGYASEKKNLDNFDRYKLPYMGIANRSEELLQIIERISQGKVPSATSSPAAKEEKPAKATIVSPDEEEEEVSSPPPTVATRQEAPAVPSKEVHEEPVTDSPQKKKTSPQTKSPRRMTIEWSISLSDRLLAQKSM